MYRILLNPRHRDETRVEFIKEGILDAFSVHGPREHSRVARAEKVEGEEGAAGGGEGAVSKQEEKPGTDNQEGYVRTTSMFFFFFFFLLSE